jgi:hypothetical protein
MYEWILFKSETENYKTKSTNGSRQLTPHFFLLRSSRESICQYPTSESISLNTLHSDTVLSTCQHVFLVWKTLYRNFTNITFGVFVKTVIFSYGSSSFVTNTSCSISITLSVFHNTIRFSRPWDTYLSLSPAS